MYIEDFHYIGSTAVNYLSVKPMIAIEINRSSDGEYYVSHLLRIKNPLPLF